MIKYNSLFMEFTIYEIEELQIYPKPAPYHLIENVLQLLLLVYNKIYHVQRNMIIELKYFNNFHISLYTIYSNDTRIFSPPHFTTLFSFFRHF